MNEFADTVSAEHELPRSRTAAIVAGTYRVLERLGAGGMGDVYEAEHARLGSKVAIKFLKANALSDARAVERFRHEARRVASLHSEYVVRVFDCGELDEGTPYLVMERLVGEDLRSLLERDGPLAISRAVKLVRDGCRGLSAVHAAGLIHRDLKPANLFVVRRAGSVELCKVLDFGVAKALASEATSSGALLGTVRYMAPEQLESSASTKAPADIYALGAILYECLVGAPAHPGESVQQIMFNILHRDPVPPSKLRPIPHELERVVLQALSRRPNERFESAESFARALAPFVAAPQGERPTEGTHEVTLSESVDVPRPMVNVRRRRAVQGASLVVAFALGISVGWLSRPAQAPIADTTSAPEPTATAQPAPLTTLAETTKSEPPRASQETPTAVPAAVLAAPADPTPVLPQPPAVATTRARVASKEKTTNSAPAPQGSPYTGRFDSMNPYVE